MRRICVGLASLVVSGMLAVSAGAGFAGEKKEGEAKEFKAGQDRQISEEEMALKKERGDNFNALKPFEKEAMKDEKVLAAKAEMENAHKAYMEALNAKISETPEGKALIDKKIEIEKKLFEFEKARREKHAEAAKEKEPKKEKKDAEAGGEK